ALPLIRMGVGIKQIGDIDGRLFRQVLKRKDYFGICRLSKNLLKAIKSIFTDEAFSSCSCLRFLPLRQEYTRLQCGHRIFGYVVVRLRISEKLTRFNKILFNKLPDFFFRRTEWFF